MKTFKILSLVVSAMLLLSACQGGVDTSSTASPIIADVSKELNTSSAEASSETSTSSLEAESVTSVTQSTDYSVNTNPSNTNSSVANTSKVEEIDKMHFPEQVPITKDSVLANKKSLLKNGYVELENPKIFEPSKNYYQEQYNFINPKLESTEESFNGQLASRFFRKQLIIFGKRIKTTYYIKADETFKKSWVPNLFLVKEELGIEAFEKSIKSKWENFYILGTTTTYCRFEICQIEIEKVVFQQNNDNTNTKYKKGDKITVFQRVNAATNQQEVEIMEVAKNYSDFFKTGSIAIPEEATLMYLILPNEGCASLENSKGGIFGAFAVFDIVPENATASYYGKFQGNSYKDCVKKYYK